MLKQWRNVFSRFGTVAAIILTALLVFGCGGGGGGSTDGGGGGGGGGGSTSPEITLSTNQLSFGNVVANAAGLRSADRSVQVTNVGTANLNVGQIAQANPLAAPFVIFEDNCSGLSLAPNASCTVIVRFTPTAASATSFTDSFDIPSNDANEASLPITVSGDGKGLNVTINKVDSSGYPNIRMIVSVTDGSNNPVTGLLQGDFAVTEEGVAQTITAFDATSATPVSMVLDLDYSISVTPVQDDVEAAAKSFLAKVTNPADEAAVIKFARTVYLASDFRPVIAQLANLNAAIDAAYPDNTEATKFFDAVYESVDRLDPRANDRQAVVVVSDGEDLDRFTKLPISTHDLEDVIANATAKKVFIFTIGLGAAIQTEIMQRMAVETGGQYFEAPDSTDLEAIYTQISEILSNQFTITFRTIRADATSNSLNVVATQPVTLLVGEDTESVTY